jgi:NADPH2:quinone reductase
MKAVFCEKLGSPDELVMREVDPPGPPAEGQVKVALRARSVSFSDVLRVAGEYQQKQPLPFVVGREGAGTVLEVGAGVTDLQPGDHVLSPGGCAEQVLVEAARVKRLPDAVSFEAAAAFGGNYATSLYALQRARLQPGETLLVHGAGGGVGLPAVELGKLLGATVIATASSQAKRDVAADRGADHVIPTEGFRERVKALTGGRGVDVIFDPVGGDVFDESMRCIAPLGRILVVGFASGRAALAKTNHLLVKDAEIIGYTRAPLERLDPARAESNTRALLGWLAGGYIRPHISHTLPLEQTIEAMNLIKQRQVIGKVVLVS